MKFGHYLETQVKKEWEAHYIDYRALKSLLSARARRQSSDNITNSPRLTSLSVSRGLPTPTERFLVALQDELKKVNQFTLATVDSLKSTLRQLSARAARKDLDADALEALSAEAHAVGDDFQALEKYVNLNFMGFFKILKKHDKHAPSGHGVSGFGLGHLRQQPWAQGRHMELVLPLSQLYAKLSALREGAGASTADPGAGYLHVVRQFWVKEEHMPAVRSVILQNLPIMPRVTEAGDAECEEVMNAIFLDNGCMELYHGRLFDKHRSITLRIKWRGLDLPDKVLVERRTYNASWKQEESYKEKLLIPRSNLLPFLQGRYSAEDALLELHEAGTVTPDPLRFCRLFRGIQELVDAKQLLPCVRAQFKRTTFQVPFDPSVRVTLDSNLVLFSEEELGFKSHKRDPSTWLRSVTHITPDKEAVGFPHQIMCVSQYLKEGDTGPPWLAELQDAGLIQEISEFSKFIHGSAALYPELVRAVPYWVDDESLHNLGSHVSLAPFRKVRISADGRVLVGRDGIGFGGKEEARQKPALPSGKALMHYNPAMYLQNERVLILWLGIAVVLASTGAGMLGFANTAFHSSRRHSPLAIVELIGLTLLPIGTATSAYGAASFWWRLRSLHHAEWTNYHNPLGHMLLACAVIFALVAILAMAAADWVMTVDGELPPQLGRPGLGPHAPAAWQER